jgi:hypothetical protein
MKKISNDDTFENYVGKFIDMNVNGTIRKFFVSNIDSGSITTNAGILYPETFSILRESSEQECTICSVPCQNHIPIIVMKWVNQRALSIGEPYLNEKHDVYINGTKVTTLNLSSFPTQYNSLLLIPFYDSLVINPEPFLPFTNGTTALSVVYIPDNLLIEGQFNNIAINPITANNLPNIYPYYGESDDFGQRIEIEFLSNQIVSVSSNNTNTIGCSSWTLYYDLTEDASSNITFTSGLFSASDVRSPNSLSAGCLAQALTSYFIYMSPCSIPTIEGYNFYSEYYYNIKDNPALESYRGPGLFGSAENLHLQKLIFYKDCSITDEIVLYYGFGADILVPYNSTDQKLYSDIGITPYNGIFVSNDSGPKTIFTVVDGEITSETNCP